MSTRSYNYASVCQRFPNCDVNIFVTEAGPKPNLLITVMTVASLTNTHVNVGPIREIDLLIPATGKDRQFYLGRAWASPT